MVLEDSVLHEINKGVAFKANACNSFHIRDTNGVLDVKKGLHKITKSTRP